MSGAIFLDGNRVDNLFVGGGGGTSAARMLASTGAQTIALPYYSNDGVVIKFKMLIGNVESGTIILGDIWSVNGVVLYTYESTLAIRCQSYLNESVTKPSWKIAEVEIDYSTGIVTIDGNTYTTGVTPSNHNQISLFGLSSHYCSVAIGDVTIKKNGADVMHLVPMQDGGTGAGYYHDTIGNTDYYSTTGTNLIYAEL